MTPDETEQPEKPIPEVDEASRPFFEGARQHRLMLQRCRSCGAHMWPVKVCCISCMGDDLEWVASSGLGTLYTYGVMHQLYHPGFASSIPYNISVVELEEGVRVTTNVVGVASSELRIGMPLRVTFEAVSSEVTIPKFEPAR